jgi:hypothetical protein
MLVKAAAVGGLKMSSVHDRKDIVFGPDFFSAA